MAGSVARNGLANDVRMDEGGVWRAGVILLTRWLQVVYENLWGIAKNFKKPIDGLENSAKLFAAIEIAGAMPSQSKGSATVICRLQRNGGLNAVFEN